jgi:hypothetical protein
MSFKYRLQRINNITKKWKLNKIHPLITSHKINKNFFKEFKFNLKLYISKAMNINFEENDKKFIVNVDRARGNRKNITPNGAIVPKREYHLEYNLVLRSWCELIKQITKNDQNLLKLFRVTPNIRIKFGKELSENKNRELSTSVPHSDAWVEGPWGMNCFIPFLGDIKNNNLRFYEPRTVFEDKFLTDSPSYKKMQWVMKYYKPISKIVPKVGHVHFSDYAAIHKTYRKENSGTRISIDTTIFVGNHLPHKDRIKEYTKKIPAIGLDQFIDSGQYEKNAPASKISAYSHYTSKVLKIIKF